jgi:hypothetical protein
VCVCVIAAWMGAFASRPAAAADSLWTSASCRAPQRRRQGPAQVVLHMLPHAHCQLACRQDCQRPIISKCASASIYLDISSHALQKPGKCLLRLLSYGFHEHSLPETHTGVDNAIIIEWELVVGMFQLVPWPRAGMLCPFRKWGWVMLYTNM